MMRIPIVVIGLVQIVLFASGPQQMQGLADRATGLIPAILLPLESPAQLAVALSVTHPKAPDQAAPATGGCARAGRRLLAPAMVGCCGMACIASPALAPARARGPPQA